MPNDFANSLVAPPLHISLGQQKKDMDTTLSKRKKATNTITRDFISALTDDVLNSILSNLTTRELIRTSILSRRWRYISSLPSTLIFDHFNIFGEVQNHEKGCDCSHYEDKFVRGVDQFVESYKGTNISCLKICFCLGDALVDNINRWVRFALQIGIQTLSLELLCDKCRRKPSTEVVKYILHRYLFEGMVTTNLRRLILVDCWIGTNFTHQLSCLKFLTVTCAPLALYDLQEVFSCLVNLKHLKLKKCVLPMVFYVGSLSCLTNLRLRNCERIQQIQMSNARLYYLEVAYCKSLSLNLNGVPNLEQLDYYCIDRRQLLQVASQVRLSTHVPKLTRLLVTFNINWAKCPPLRTTIVLTEITSLKLHLLKKTEFDIVKMVSVLGVFPCLRLFSLVTHCENDKEYENLQLETYIHRHLRSILIGGFYGTLLQIGFAKYLLKHAPDLKQLIIQQEVKGLICKQPYWDEAERQRVYANLCNISEDVKLIVR